MTLGIPSLFPPRPEFFISVDYHDFITGAGVVLFYGAKDVASGDHELVSSTNISATVDQEYIYGVDAGVFSVLADNTTTTINYDSQIFNSSRKINGVVRAAIPVGVAEADNSGGAIDIGLSSVKLIQVHGIGGTTDLSAAVSVAVIPTSSKAFMLSWFVKLGLINNITIKKGDKIRLAIIYDTTASSDQVARAYHSPGKASDTITGGGTETATSTNTRLVLEIPFAIPN